ncbi:MAG: hypothetical protein ACWGQW_24865, partial [bacterium]
LAVKGDASRIKELADAFGVIRGVQQSMVSLMR